MQHQEGRESTILGPKQQSQSQRELDEKAGTVIGKIKAKYFRKPSRGDLKPGKETVCDELPLGGRELIRALPALTTVLENGCNGDHSKAKKGGSWHPYIMFEKKKSRQL